jgi:glucosyl-3-phosphoglycerate synthase
MSDFFQHGMISTLHRLADGPLRDQAKEGYEAQDTVLVLPCHYSEIGSESLHRIIAQLNKADFLSEVIVSMNGFEEKDINEVTRFWQNLEIPRVVLWNDDPGVLDQFDAAKIQWSSGKGLNVWLAFGWVGTNRYCKTIVIHDCDIQNYDLDLPLTLAMPTGALGYAYSKGYYSRVRDALYGRVTRLFMIPLVRSLTRVLGHMPMLDFIDSFRYPLSGECSLTRETALNLSVESDWGLEIGWLCELHRLVDPSQVCQVDLAILYDHKHQLLDTNRPQTGLLRMVSEIARSLLTNLEREGAQLDTKMLGAVQQAYRSASTDFVRRYRDVARLNCLAFDESREAEAIEAFASAFENQCSEFLGGSRSKSLPPWRQLLASGFEPRFRRIEN